MEILFVPCPDSHRYNLSEQEGTKKNNPFIELDVDALRIDEAVAEYLS